MTPLAARLFRSTRDKDLRKVLAGAQFFECSRLYSLAKEMVTEDIKAGCDIFSEMAQLPAQKSAIEFMMGPTRVLLLAEQNDTILRFMTFLPDRKQGAVFAMISGFEIGTRKILNTKWMSNVLTDWASSIEMDPGDFAEQQSKGLNSLLEKMLCMMNQQGLIERDERSADRRTLREATRDGIPEVTPIWAECRIRPGRHGQGASDENAATMKLHYVRKYFKPSLQKWIEGYWRGDADLGVHLKWYSISAPRVRS